MAERAHGVTHQPSAKAHVLIVEDDAAVSKLIESYLDREGYNVAVAGTVADMRAAVEAGKVDVIILDVVLPDEDGWSALRWIRARGEMPVMLLTGKGETVDKIVGLELGADDYLAKPFDLRELLARLHSIQRRAERASAAVRSAPEEPIRFSGWVFDLVTQQLKSEAGEVTHLTQAEYRILSSLVCSPRKTVTRDQLMAIVGRSWEPLDRSIDVHVSNLRRKINSDSKRSSLIRTIRGLGYMFVPDRE
jgi:two-component system OmpR family response regulator